VPTFADGDWDLPCCFQPSQRLEIPSRLRRPTTGKGQTLSTSEFVRNLHRGYRPRHGSGFPVAPGATRRHLWYPVQSLSAQYLKAQQALGALTVVALWTESDIVVGSGGWSSMWCGVAGTGFRRVITCSRRDAHNSIVGFTRFTRVSRQPTTHCGFGAFQVPKNPFKLRSLPNHHHG
jgi:hypothetical protein